MAALARALSIVMVLCGAIALCGCEDTGRAGATVTPVKVKGRTFWLEVAANEGTRTKGLGERTHIDEDGGMIFVFPGREEVHEFVMRDCPIPIDVIFTDGSGRVIAVHEMQPEEPRRPAEGAPGVPSFSYETRLKKYSSKLPSPFAVELRGGMAAKLGVKETDKLEFDVAGLKARAR